MIYRRIRITWLGLALAVAACAGTFTRVPLPTVTSGEERAAGAAAGMLTLEQAEHFMHENFYRIVYDEEAHSSGESRDAFVTRMFASETISPTLLTSITPTQFGQPQPTAQCGGFIPSLPGCGAIPGAAAPAARASRREDRSGGGP